MPLHSETDRSNRGNSSLADSDRARIAGGAQDSGTVLSSPDGSATILRRRYPAFEGPIANGPHLRIGLSVSGSARLVQHVGGGRLEAAGGAVRSSSRRRAAPGRPAVPPST
ncbi:hypothetical protein ACNFJ7_07810 [Sphingomonas sp. HT-1]|uniref:hypothetical protein n=1 Tax=unclassified Sphingomonas TaxID=196159 RepID=UPI00036AC508|nr:MULTISPECIES: hypothetical protein [unclassified Sphingomonas]KTF68277.1 hypothetical protein ATB93_14840 [Sphingomonas sp. WG]